MLTGKTSDQIRSLFHIENDWSPEEEEKMKEELQWLQN
jgi:S-phase kinase-associated protein 1